MARTDSLVHFLTDIADSIRNKKGIIEPIKADSFDEEIESIETGIIPTGTFTITENGNYDVSTYANADVNVQADVGDYNAKLEHSGSSSSILNYIQEITNIDLTNLSSYSNFFSGSTNLIKINNLQLGQATNASNMFYECSRLGTIPYINTENFRNMSSMFEKCTWINNLPEIDMAHVTNASGMFRDCASLKTFTLLPMLSKSEFSTSCSLSRMFYGCSNLTEVPNFVSNRASTMANMFCNCPKLTTVPQFDTSSVTDMTNMFYQCYELTEIPQFNTSNVISMGNMFYGCSKLTIVPQLNTSKVTGMGGMFRNCSKLTQVPQFDTSKVTSISEMFYNCSELIEIPQFDTSNVTYMMSAFRNVGCEIIDLGDWNLAKIPNTNDSNCSEIFRNSANLKKVVLPASLRYLGKNSFSSCPNLTTIILKNPTPLGILSTTFSGMTSEGYSIYVPDESVQAYKTAPNWTNIADRIKPMSEYIEE